MLGAAITAIDVQGLLRTIDLDCHPALPLDTADVDVQGTAIARITDLHAGHAVEQIACGNTAEAVDLFAVQVHRRVWRPVGIRLWPLGGGLDHRRR
ncbi:hypothetical protein D3C79_810520 [compost metagenome]